MKNLDRYVCGDGEMIICKKDKDYPVDVYVKLEDIEKYTLSESNKVKALLLLCDKILQGPDNIIGFSEWMNIKKLASIVKDQHKQLLDID